VVTDLFEGFGRWVGGSSDDGVGENINSPCKNQKHALEVCFPIDRRKPYFAATLWNVPESLMAGSDMNVCFWFIMQMEKGQTVGRILQKRRLCDTLSKQVVHSLLSYI